MSGCHEKISRDNQPSTQTLVVAMLSGCLEASTVQTTARYELILRPLTILFTPRAQQAL